VRAYHYDVAQVLVVDDEPDIRETVSEALAVEGYDVEVARDGLEALAACRAHRPDLVLLDLMMPGMNGWEFRAAQQSDPALASIPVVVVSALGRVPALHAEAWLQKPFGLDRLVDEVRRHVGPPPGVTRH
jgi:CheY-like chemotaxis protein